MVNFLRNKTWHSRALEGVCEELYSEAETQPKQTILESRVHEKEPPPLKSNIVSYKKAEPKQSTRSRIV